MAQGFNDNLYLIDLSYLNTPAEVVYDLSSILDTELAKNQRVKLKLGSVDFNKSQLLSIKSLVESINSTLTIVDGKSEITRSSAIAIGLVYQNSADMVPDTVFTDKVKNEAMENPVIAEVKPELFPEVSPVKQEPEVVEEKNESVDITAKEQSELCETDDSENSNNEKEEDKLTDTSSDDEEKVEESFEICPQKFETTEENLEFDENKDEDWLKSETQNEQLENGFASSNWDSPRMPQNEAEDVVVSDETDNNQETAKAEENSKQSENQENTAETDVLQENKEMPKIYGIENFEEKEQEPEKEETQVIQSLEDIPLDIPNDKTIQEELSVIYNTERKLEDVFANTGLKEEKFQSIKETPKAEEREYTQYDFELEAFPTKYLKQTICAGQFISFEGNLVVIGDCHEGSEISAAGEITVWGELSGSAHAGKNGNEKCKIRALKMNASQLRIANCYVKRPTVLNTRAQLPADSIPEEAKIQNGEIIVYKIYK